MTPDEQEYQDYLDYQEYQKYTGSPAYSAPTPQESPGVVESLASGGLSGVAGLGDLVDLAGRGAAFLNPINLGYRLATGENMYSEPAPSVGDELRKSFDSATEVKDSTKIGEGTLPHKIGSYLPAMGMGGGSLVAGGIKGTAANTAKLLGNTALVGTGGYVGEQAGGVPGEIVGAVGAGLLPSAATGLLSLGSKAKSFFSPSTIGTKDAQEIVKELRTIAPKALTEKSTQGEKAKQIISSIESRAKEQEKAAGALFNALPNEQVAFDDALINIEKMVEKVGGPVTPGSNVEGLLSKLRGYKQQDKVVSTPASSILDASGKPMTAATTMVIPAGPTKLSLPEFQNVLRDVGYKNPPNKVEKLIIAKTKEELSKSVEKSVSPQAYKAFSEARDTWSTLSKNYREGAVGKSRLALKEAKGRISTFKNMLLNDPKSAEQLTRVMTPEELGQTQSLLLSEMFKMQPVSWEGFIAKHGDSFNATFGKDNTNKLLDMVAKDGSVGRKLLQDNNGLGALMARTLFKSGAAATAGAITGNPAIAMLAFAGTAGRTVAKGKANSYTKSLFLRSIAGNEKALSVLNSPAKSGVEYSRQLKQLSKIMGSSAKAPIINSAAQQSRGLLGLGGQDVSNDYQSDDVSTKKKSSPVATPSAKPTPIFMAKSSVPESLVKAVIAQESGGRADAVSKEAGAQGLMQLMPATGKELAARVGVKYDPFDPEQNKQLGSLYLQDLLSKYDGDIELALTAYHTGMGNVDKYLKEEGGTTLSDIKHRLGPVGKKYAEGVLKRIKDKSILV